MSAEALARLQSMLSKPATQEKRGDGEGKRGPIAERRIEWQGKSWTIRALATEYGMTYQHLKHRIDKLEWDLEKALTTPVKRYKQNNPD